MDKSKRKFIKTVLAGIGLTIVGGTIISNLPINRSQGITVDTNQEDEPTSDKIKIDVPDDPKHHWGFLIDISKCNGCEDLDPPEDDPMGLREKPRCSLACRKAHYYLMANPPQYWIRVYQQQENRFSEPFHFPKPCMNCENPPCARVCPTGATFKRKDGTVLINHKICIGCRFCMAACPYETRFFWYWEPTYQDEEEKQKVNSYEYSPEHPIPHKRGTVVKCDYCLHMAYNKRLPTCVTACPRGALYYGDLNQDAVSNGHEVVALKKSLDENGGYRYKEGENTNPSVFYLAAGFHNELYSKTNARIDIEIRPSKTINTSEICIHVYSETGKPIKSASIRVLRETFVGKLPIFEGITDSKGYLSCSCYSPQLNGQTIIAELTNPHKYKGLLRKKHVK